MQHGIPVAKNTNAALQAIRKVAMRNPVRHHVVGFPWNQHTHIHTTLDSGLQCIQQHVIGDEVRGGEQNRLLCLIDGRNIHIANRK